ncbi:chorismate mutase [Rhizobium sp. Leaf384]|uniref:chorismate mutase n=1 Tax=unclassified Rhizobium TaxID=2613769 RepID=UPI000712CD48|nr:MULTISPECIES: chorismate mutase family protein [unclassified Rhizobium]KQS81029.1 chorismate mutase [Rhizobium sp. Leaf384]KQS86883.1 chorismate mutase [Rhizobium sp. Leaf383]
MKTAAECQSMADIRTEIDRLDETLMRLLAERWSYIGRAAEIKTTAGLPADIPSRVDEVRANVRRHATELGLDPHFYDAIWSQLIRHSIVREEEILGPQNPGRSA